MVKFSSSNRFEQIPVTLALSLLILFSFSCDSGGKDRDTRFNVVLVMADTLRADHLSSYGYRRPTSPHIDSFAREHLLFLNNRSQAACTFPSVNSLLTSRDPFEFVNADDNSMGISDAVPYLPRILQDHGYRTFAISTSPIVRKNPSGFNRTGGFESGFDVFHDNLLWGDAEEVNELLRTTLRKEDQPFFAYLHYIDIHDPYRPPKSTRDKFAKSYRGLASVGRGNPNQIAKVLLKTRPAFAFSDRDIDHLVDLYDEEILYFDEQFEELLQILKNKGVYRDTIVILTSDHGEEFNEHDQMVHCLNLYETLIHTPLIMRLPGSKHSGVRPQLSQNLDVVPTLLDYLGIDSSPYGLHGKSLRPAIEAEQDVHEAVHSAQGPHRGIVDRRYKLIHELRDQTSRLFDMRADREEKNDIAKDEPGLAAEYLARLNAWGQKTQGTSREEIIEAERQAEDQLRALGYLP